MVERLLVIEDQASQLRAVESSLHYPVSYLRLEEGGVQDCMNTAFPSGKPLPALVIIDLEQFSEAHMGMVRSLRAARPLLPLMVLTRFGDALLRQQLYQLGVGEVLARPLETDQLLHCIGTMLKIQRMSLLIARLERQVSGMMRFSDLVGVSAPFRHALALAEHATQHQKHVLIEGESGTGKTLLARAIHSSSTPAAAFAILDCENLPEDAQSYIFSPGLGKLDEARGGTLLLRAPGELPQALQHRLMEALQRMDGPEPPLRVIATSSVALEPLIRKGLFSPALYRLLRRSFIPMPSLQERREDIPLLAEHLLAMHTAREHKYIRRFSEDALHALANAHWPGNVAQLSDLVWRCSMLCNHDMIDAGTLRLVQQLEPVHYAGQMQLAADTPTLVDAQGRIKKLKSIEEEAIQYALTHYGGSMTKAARSLGIGRSTLYRRMLEKSKGEQGQMPRPNQTTRPIMRMSPSDFS